MLGAAAGATLAAAGLWLGSADTSTTGVVQTRTSPPGPSPVEPEWVPGGGIRFASTVLRPDPLDVTDGAADLRYGLVPLGAPTGSLPVVLPEVWMLRTADGRAHAATTPPPRVDVDEAPAPVAASVRFADLGADAGTGDVVQIAVTRWRVAVPVETQFEMPSQPGSSFGLQDGTTVILAAVIEQDSGSILDFDIAAVPDVWREVEANPFGRITTFRGVGPGWVSSSSTIGGTGLVGGSTGFQLRRSEREVPATIGIVYTDVAWVPLDATVVIADG